MLSQSENHGFYAAIDLQDFKLINSTCGIVKGDETLQSVSKVLQSHLKRDEFFARIDADRFLVIFWDKDKASLEPRLQEICKDLEALSVELNIPRIFPLFGIYETSDHQEVEQNYGKAVQAKHIIKGNRSRHYAFYDEINMNQILQIPDFNFPGRMLHDPMELEFMKIFDQVPEERRMTFTKLMKSILSFHLE